MGASDVARLQKLVAANDRAGALALAERLLADAGLAGELRVATLRLRSLTHERGGQRREALADLQSARVLKPLDARLAHDAGLLLADLGERERAAEAFREATTLDPGYARAHSNLGALLRDSGDLDGALRAFQSAVAAKADYALAWANLGATQRDLGLAGAAIESAERALAIDPKQRTALLLLAALRRTEGAIDVAAELYARAILIKDDDAEIWLRFAGTLAERDDLDRARQAYDRALALDPGSLRALFGRHLQLPTVAASTQSLSLACAAYAEGLGAVAAALPCAAAPIATDRLLDELRWINWLLAYHGEDERPLQEKFAHAVASAIEAKAAHWRAPLARRDRHGAPIRVGFLSTHFRDGTVGRYFERWVTDLDRERFEVHVYHLLPGRDALAARLAARADYFQSCPHWRPSQIAPLVRSNALDVLVYPELGLDPTTFALAALRLAPLQCAAWGHPVTTGHTTIDVFFSSEVMEPPEAASHYTERLVLLPGIGTRYAKSPVPADAERARFGLPETAVLFLCPQSHYKIHPENDALFARVLAAVPASRLVLFEGRHPRLTATYLARLSAALASAGIARDRLLLLQTCPHEDYMRINAVCDAMLDTLRWSGGNTSLDALAAGLPIVTLPGRFMRGRQSAGMLRLIGCDELVARDWDDYVRIAARLADDRGWRDALSARIVTHADRLFDDPAPISALADFLAANG